MKKQILILLCFCVSVQMYAQRKAVTETGEEVFLYEDGTWKYVYEKDIESIETPTNPQKFKKSENSTFLLKSKKFNVGFWLDAKKWTFKSAISNTDAEYEIQLKDGDLYGGIITEKVEIPLVSLKNIAMENARTVAPDIYIVKEEYRIVNGLKVLLLQMNGTMQGIKATYYGYYFSSSKGTVQLVTYTAQNLFENYKDDCEELLNGMVEIK